MAYYNVSSNIDITPPPQQFYPTEPAPIEYDNAVYSYGIALCLVLLILGITKIIIKRKQNKNRRTAPRTARTARARQGQIPTVSGSVDANSVISSDPPSTSQSSAASHFKVDLPPTYDEVMKNFLQAKEAAAAASPEANASIPTTPSTHGIDAIDMEDPPPPPYSAVQTS